MPAPASFTILTVCTGNICRSPAAERLLAQGLGPGVTVHSAGTGALDGYPIDQQMAALLDCAGVPTDGFAARQVVAAHLRASDLVLALTTAHRADMLQLAPAAVRRSFTLLEFARVVGSVDFPTIPAGDVAHRLREMVTVASRHRMLGEVINGDDVPDPYRRGPEAFEASFELIKTAVDVIVEAAWGPGTWRRQP